MKDLYHVIGYPVKHSLSPKIQMELAKKYNQNILFTAIEVTPENLEKKLKEFRHNHQIKGLSITLPHKEKVFELADDASKTANALKAASNVVFTSDRKMIALNYDGLGIINDIKSNHGVDFNDKKVLIIGAGGAAKAVVAAVIEQNPMAITIANRTREKAESVRKMFEQKFTILVQDFNKISGIFDIIINSTSSSLNGGLLPLSVDNFSKKAFGYDLMYGSGGTIFTKWCQASGIKATDGSGMLQELSKAVFKYWRGL